MSVRTDVINLNVNVNGNKAQNELNTLKKRAADLKFEMEGLNKRTTEYKNKKAELAQVQAQMDSLKKSIGITALTQKELINELTKLKALKGSVAPFSDEFKKLEKDIKTVEKRLYDVKNGTQGLASFFFRINDQVKQFGVLAAGYLGFQFITSQFQNIIRNGAKVSDQLADIRRVTGLTAVETERLNIQLSGLNTRTSTEGLRNIAIIAGKLGVAKEDIFEFTAAVDQLVVALGDELGDADQITTQLGKILNVFDEEGKVTGDNLLKAGNALVDLANKGVASGGFIVDFTQRLAGLAKTANLSLAASFGLGAGLEELGQRSESSSTALIKVLGAMGTDVPKFAKIAGKSVEEFTKILRESPEEALIQVSEALVKGKKGFDEISAAFDAAGEDGARVVTTLSVIGGKAEFMRGKIQDAGTALQSTSEIQEAFALKNETFGATLDKLGKEFNKLVTSSAVTNFLKDATQATLDFIRWLKDLPTWLNENRTVLIALTGILITYISAKTRATAAFALFRIQYGLMIAQTRIYTALLSIAKAAIIAYTFVKDVLTNKIKLATVAQQFFNNVVKANPLAFTIGLLAAAATAFSYFASSVTKANDAAKNNADVMGEVNKATQDTKSEIASLSAIMTSSTASTNEKTAALERMRNINRESLGDLTLENIATQEGINIIAKYIKSLDQLADAKAKVNLKSKLKEQLLETDNTLMGLEVEKANTPKLTGAKKFALGNDGKFFGMGDRNEYDVNEDIKKETENKGKIINRIQALNTDTQNQIESYRKLIAGKSTQLKGLKQDSDEAKKLARDIATDQKALNILTGLDNGAPGTGTTITGGNTITASNAVTLRLLKKQKSDLEEAYEGIDVTNTKALTENFKKREALQRQIDALEGRNAKKTSGQKEVDQLKKDAEAFKKEIEKLQRDLQISGMGADEQEIARIQDKYADLLARAKKVQLRPDDR